MKKIFIILMFLLGTFTVTGCKEDEPIVNADGTTTISFFGWGSAEEQKNYQELVDKFNTEQDKIIVTYSGTSSTTYMTTLRNRANNLPDVFYMPDYEFMSWAAEGKLLSLDEYVTQDEIDSIWGVSSEMYRFNDDTLELGSGSLYGLPKDLGPFTLVYNESLIKEIIDNKDLDLQLPSATEPMTFTEFADYLTQLKYTKEGKNIFGISHYELNAAVYSNNANFFSNDQKNSLINTTNFQDAIQYIADLDLVHGVMPNASEQASISGYDRFLNQGCLFSFMGPWDMKAFWETVDFDYNIVPVPVGEAEGSKSTTWIGSVAYAISAKTRKTEAATTFARWLTFNEDAQSQGYKLGQAMPNLMNMAKKDFVEGTSLTGKQLNPTNKQVWVDIVSGTDKIAGKLRANYYLYDNSSYDSLLSSLEDIYTGKKTAKQVLDIYHIIFQEGLNENASYFN